MDHRKTLNGQSGKLFRIPLKFGFFSIEMFFSKLYHRMILTEKRQDISFFLFLGLGLLVFNLVSISVLDIPIAEAIIDIEKLKSLHVVTIHDGISFSDKLSTGR